MTLIIRLVVSALFWVSLAPAPACAPTSAVRRTAFVPAATLPARTGGAMAPGELRVMGHANGLNTGVLVDPLPLTGSPGLLVPQVHLGASLYGALEGGLELGAQFTFAANDWGQKNAAGVLSFPKTNAPHLWSFGGGLRYNFELDEPRLQLSLLTEINFSWIPQATFACGNVAWCSGDATVTDSRAEEIYRLERVDTDMFILPQLALQVGWAFGEHFVIYSHLGTQRLVKNIGFDDNPDTSRDTLSGHWALTVGAGVETQIEAFVASATFFYPFIFAESLEIGGSFLLSAGVRFR